MLAALSSHAGLTRPRPGCQVGHPGGSRQAGRRWGRGPCADPELPGTRAESRGPNCSQGQEQPWEGTRAHTEKRKA